MKTDEHVIFCENIIYLMRKNNLSDKEMAKIMHVGPKTFSLIKENVLPRSITMRNVFYVCDYFKVPPKEIFKEK